VILNFKEDGSLNPRRGERRMRPVYQRRRGGHGAGRHGGKDGKREEEEEEEEEDGGSHRRRRCSSNSSRRSSSSSSSEEDKEEDDGEESDSSSSSSSSSRDDDDDHGRRARGRAIATSTYRGVYFSKKLRRCWWAAVCIGNHKKSAGFFQREEDAARAYDAKVTEYYSRPIFNFDRTTGERNKYSKQGRNLGPLPAAFPYLSKAAGEGKASSSIYRGVSFRSRERKWGAVITYGGREIYAGTYDTEEMAARGYDAAVSRFFGRPVRNFDPATDLPNPDRKLDVHR
jgi:hypothetical protein